MDIQGIGQAIAGELGIATPTNKQTNKQTNKIKTTCATPLR